MLCVIGGLCYYGWPVIEAVLLLLPIPDPKDMKEKAKGYCTQAMDFLLSLPDMLSGGNGEGRAPTPGYQSAFNAPGSLHDDDDDDDEEDIGKDMAPK